MSDFPDILKQLRTDCSLTQSELASRLNVTQNAIHQWENGKREPNSDTIEKLADIFSVTPSYLMGWRNEDVKIDSEIDQIIERIKNEELEQTEISRLVQKITDLTNRQLVIEDNIKKEDLRFLNNLSNQAIHFDSDEYSESELEEIKNFAEFLKTKRI